LTPRRYSRKLELKFCIVKHAHDLSNTQ
jgi:hypothetical protein